MNKKILIVEDEESIGDILSYALSKEGFVTKVANNGAMARELLDKFIPNLVILDLMLPDINGLDLCKLITKNYNVPIIMITAKSDPVDKILGIELGADDYITKPFNIREVIARVKALFRRIELISSNVSSYNTNVIKLRDNIEIHTDERSVIKDNSIVDLTNKEYDLLLYLAQNKGRILSRSQILDSVWGIDFVCDTRTVDIHVQRVRKKLDENKNNSIIETAFGIGYKLVN